MTVREAIEQRIIGGRLWFYTNYHCNLACTYCLTESSPTAQRRLLDHQQIIDSAEEAAQLGFTNFGVTGGEPFLVPEMPELLAELARRKPTTVLTNGTLFTDRLLAKLTPLNVLPLAIQMSLDSADMTSNDARRGTGNYRQVTEAVLRLQAANLHVRIGSTVSDDPEEIERLREGVAKLGIAAVDHVVRPTARLGRAATNDIGIPVEREDIAAELTLTADGAFFSPAAPAVRDERVMTRLLLTRTISPLSIPAEAMLRVSGTAPPPVARVSCA